MEHERSNDLSAAIEKTLASGALDVPMLPETAARVITLSQDPESDAAQLARLIQSDQSLAAHVMRIANSAAYTPSAALVSLQQAITRLGMNLISEIALAASINTKMFHAPGFEQRLKHIWQHALATALWAKEIARLCRRNVESSFLCGLLHSIGDPVCLQLIAEKTSAKDIPDATIDTLLNEFGNRITGQVLSQWKMPSIVRESAAYLNNHTAAPTAKEVAATVIAAAAMANAMLNEHENAVENLLQLEVLEELNLYNDEVHTLWQKAALIKSTMEAMAA